MFVITFSCDFRFYITKYVDFPRGGVLPYIDYTGMCRCRGYVFQAFLSRTGYRKHDVLGQEQGDRFKLV